MPIKGDQFHLELLCEGYIDGIAASDPLFGGDFRGSGREGLGHRKELHEALRAEEGYRLPREFLLAKTSPECGSHLG